jgi:hypothetical protein
MKSLGSGRIIFVSSQVAQVVIHGYTAYAASKWALRGFAEVTNIPFSISLCALLIPVKILLRVYKWS